jgi:uncharacterized protein (DUF433 family)
MSPQTIGRYIVADPRIDHGKPTFRGTRVFVADVLEMVANGVAWETIIEQWHKSITKDAIGEAVKLSSEAFLGRTTFCVPHGVAGQQLLAFAGTIPSDDTALMRQAIEDGCERVDANGW